MDFGLADQNPGYDVDSGDASESANSVAANLSIELPAQDTDVEQEDVIATNRHTPELASRPVGDGNS